MSIRLKVFFIIMVISVVIIVFGIGSGLVSMLSSMQTAIEKDMKSMADIADQLVSSKISQLSSDAARTADVLLLAPEDLLSQTLKEQTEANDEFISMAVFTRHGLAASYGSAPTPESFLDSEYIQRAFAGEQSVSTTRLDPTGLLVFHVNVPMGEGRVLSVTIPGMLFSDLLSQFTLWETGHIFLDDGEGYVIANIRPTWVQDRVNFIELAKTEGRYQDIAETISRMIRGETGKGRFFIDGVERICVYRPVSGSNSGWSLGVIVPLKESVLPDVRNGLIQIGIVCLFLSVLAAFFASAIIARSQTTINTMNTTLEYQAKVMQAINETAAILLRSDVDRFNQDLWDSMNIFAKCVGVDRMRIWENQIIDEKLYCSQVYEWSEGAEPQQGKKITENIPYSENIPGWEEKLTAGNSVNGIVRTFSKEEQDQLSPQGIISILVIPVFFHDNFWGFVAFDDCNKERIFSADEENLLRSGGLLIADAMLRNEMTLDLIQAREIALSGTQAKSRFLANTSHEMRTPLNAIIGFSEMLLESGEMEGEDYDNLEKIHNSGMTLLGIVNDVLDISKIESGKFEMLPVEYYTPSIINDIITLNIMRINDKPIKFELHLDENFPEKLFGDELRIKQIFNNLLSNAFKYTRQGRVEWDLSFEKDGDSVWIVSTVSDSGIGIKKEDIQKLFSDYNQVDTRSNRSIEGTGLGLSITRRIIEMMDGSISVESEYGKGSTFKIRLRQTAIGADPIGKEMAGRICAFNYIDSQRKQNSQLVRARLPYAKVLVVDDVQTNLDVARGMMKPYGMQVDCVLNGQAAIDLIRKADVRYSAVFMDHMMPGMDGIEAVRIIRNEIGTEYARNVPIIALTANAIVGNEEMFLNHGFQAFLSKPINIMRLDSIINHWVRNKKLEASLVVEEPDAPADSASPAEGGTGEALFPADTVIPGMDLQEGLGRFSGDRELYLNVLKSYVRNTPPLLEQIRACTEDGLPHYAIVVHGIKSSSYGIGAQAAGALAEALEQASKTGDFDFVRRKNDDFIAETERLVAGISALLEGIDGAAQKPRKAEPSKETLNALLDACKRLDISGIDNALGELEAYSYDSGAELVEWLRNQVNISGFTEIEERLGQG